MKILIFSDSHGSSQNLLDVLSKEHNKICSCFFLGDGMADMEKVQAIYPALPVFAARGNCDLGDFTPSEGLAPIGGKLFFFTHGHNYSVKTGLSELWWAAKQKKADIALYGHTHVPFYELRQGIHLFNPGSISSPRSGKASYGQIVFEGGMNPSFDIVYI